eukprot:Nk52_evm13s2596 gene=Nk52_evmTU13s2596
MLAAPAQTNTMNQQQQQPQEGGGNNAPFAMSQTVPLSQLLDHILQQTYHDFSVLSELLPRKSDSERKLAILHFVHTTRQKLMRLLVLVKWAKNAHEIQKSSIIASFLEEQSNLFRSAADALYFLHVRLAFARAPAYNIPTAIDVLTTGKYSRLPTAIQSVVPQPGLSDEERDDVFAYLNTCIRVRLLNTRIPDSATQVHVEAGRCVLTVRNHFEITLTAVSSKPNEPWRVLKVAIMVRDPTKAEGGSSKGEARENKSGSETGKAVVGAGSTGGTNLKSQRGEDVDEYATVSESQLENLRTMLQHRADCPAIENHVCDMFTVCHHFCNALIINVLSQQAAVLSGGKWSNSVSCSMELGSSLTLTYWHKYFAERDLIELRSSSRKGNSEKKGLFDTGPPKLIIRSDPPSVECPMIRITHEPKLTAPNSHIELEIPFSESGVFSESPSVYLNIEKIFMRATASYSRCRIEEIARTLSETKSDKGNSKDDGEEEQTEKFDFRIITDRISGRSSAACATYLVIRFFADKYVKISIDLQSGCLLLRFVKIIENSGIAEDGTSSSPICIDIPEHELKSVLAEQERELNSQGAKSVFKVVRKLKYNYIVSMYESCAKELGLLPYRSMPILLSGTGPNKAHEEYLKDRDHILYISFPYHPMFLLVVKLNPRQALQDEYRVFEVRMISDKNHLLLESAVMRELEYAEDGLPTYKDDEFENIDVRHLMRQKLSIATSFASAKICILKLCDQLKKHSIPFEIDKNSSFYTCTGFKQSGMMDHGFTIRLLHLPLDKMTSYGVPISSLTEFPDDPHAAARGVPTSFFQCIKNTVIRVVDSRRNEILFESTLSSCPEFSCCRWNYASVQYSPVGKKLSLFYDFSEQYERYSELSVLASSGNKQPQVKKVVDAFIADMQTIARTFHFAMIFERYVQYFRNRSNLLRRASVTGQPNEKAMLEAHINDLDAEAQKQGINTEPGCVKMQYVPDHNSNLERGIWMEDGFEVKVVIYDFQNLVFAYGMRPSANRRGQGMDQKSKAESNEENDAMDVDDESEGSRKSSEEHLTCFVTVSWDGLTSCYRCSFSGGISNDSDNPHRQCAAFLAAVLNGTNDIIAFIWALGGSFSFYQSLNQVNCYFRALPKPVVSPVTTELSIITKAIGYSNSRMFSFVPRSSSHARATFLGLYVFDFFCQSGVVCGRFSSFSGDYAFENDKDPKNRILYRPLLVALVTYLVENEQLVDTRVDQDDPKGACVFIPAAYFNEFLIKVMNYIGSLVLFEKLADIIQVGKTNSSGIYALSEVVVDREKLRLTCNINSLRVVADVQSRFNFAVKISNIPVEEDDDDEDDEDEETNSKLTEEAAKILEEFVDKRIACHPYNFAALLSYMRLLSLPAHVLNDFVNLMQADLINYTSETSGNRLELLMCAPPSLPTHGLVLNTDTSYFLPTPGDICVFVDDSYMLFMVRFFHPKTHKQIDVPIVYSIKHNWTSGWEKEHTDAVTDNASSTTNSSGAKSRLGMLFSNFQSSSSLAKATVPDKLPTKCSTRAGAYLLEVMREGGDGVMKGPNVTYAVKRTCEKDVDALITLPDHPKEFKLEGES